MTFEFQQPGSQNLLNIINDSALNADCGGGVFAFASKDGINTLFKCPNIIDMLENGKKYHLIIGLDAITNAESLFFLQEKLNEYPSSLIINAFFHQQRTSTFHPKFSWFKKRENITIIVGSGNLTSRGLGKSSTEQPFFGNWEAFCVQHLSGSEAITTYSKINTWLREQTTEERIRSINDLDVQSKAMENGRVHFYQSKLYTDSQTTVHTTIPSDSREILLRELPRNRSGQADVGKSALSNFFGYEGQAKDILIQHVSLENQIDNVESIRLFVNKSKNYRLELHAISTLDYKIGDHDCRMILVATKLDHRSFRYTIIPVTSVHYNDVSKLLGPLPTGHRRLMRETRVSSQDLKDAWQDVPSNLLLIELETPEL